MAHIALSGGELEYRVFAADGHAQNDASAATVLFVHGFLVSGTLWDPVAKRLAADAVTSVVPDFPLGSHRRPWGPGELSPTSLGSAINELCEALDLNNVVLVGSNTGGALCQLALREPSPRIAGLVLTNCDGFEVFPPKFFVPLFYVAQNRAATWTLLQNTRVRSIRHSPLGYGRLLNAPRPAELTRSWVEPALGDAAIRHDINRFARALDRDELVDAGSWLARFDGPSRIVWGMQDGCFVPSIGRRLVDALPNATFIEAESATTFVSIDAPDVVADAIESCLEEVAADSACN